METLLAFFVFIFGLIIGSFLNVVIYRYNTGTTIGGRSMCFSCGKTLKWYELVPVLSFVFLRGKCGVCKSKISWQYPAVELATGFLFLLVFFAASNIYLLVYLLIQISLLVVIAVYDIRHKIIPDKFVYIFAGLALLNILYVFWEDRDVQVLLFDTFAGPVYFAPFAALWYFSNGKWMGFGDAKLALGIGWFLGMSSAYIAIILAFWTGALFGLSMIVCSRITQLFVGKEKVTMKSEIPFGPFLILGLVAVAFFESWVVGILSTFIFYYS